MQLWIDVEDLFVHSAGGQRRMSGIQRFEAELCRALYAGVMAGALPGIVAVRFIRHEAAYLTFREVEWAELRALLAELSADAPGSEPVAPAPAAPALALEIAEQPQPPPPVRWPRRMVRRLPLAVRRPVHAAVRSQRDALQKSVVAARAVVRAVLWRRESGQGREPATEEPRFDRCAEPPTFDFGAVPGDFLLNAGAPWIFPRYPAHVAALRRRGIRFAALIHDLIPLRRPEWCDPKHTRTFREWLDATLPQCDALFTVSHASARDIVEHAEQSGIPLPREPVVVPMGGGFAHSSGRYDAERPHLPAPGSYALFVSTLEPRKNQAFLVQVWRQLLVELPRERVPTLVLAGHVSSAVGDMLQELRNCFYLDGAVKLISNASDAELAALYRGCRFTLFPSLYEGWGLPVTESLAFGKPCLASDTTSVPEAGGTLARYFDPLNIRSGVLAVRNVIERPESLAAWQAQIAREHRPTPWRLTAQEVIAGLNPSELKLKQTRSVGNRGEFATG